MKNFLNRFIINIVMNVLTFALVVYLIDGVQFAPYLLTQKEKIKTLILAGLCLGVLNAFIKPILKLISLPFIILSLGIFLFIINLFILFLTTFFVPDLLIIGFSTYIYVALIFALVNTLEHIYLKFYNKKNS